MAIAALNISSTGLKARELDIAVIANNIANVSTGGFKTERAEFQDLIYQDLKKPGTLSSDNGSVVPTGIQIGTGTVLSGTYSILNRGELKQTQATYDLAITGNSQNSKGYFRIEMPDGSFAYTKSGSFRTGPNSEIVNDQGYIVSPGIIIPNQTTQIEINKNGQVLATTAGNENAQPQLIGQLDIVDFPNPSGLLRKGANLLIETSGSGAPILGVAGLEGMGEILQGWLETSNVDPVIEMTSLIVAQRGYELNSKVIEAASDTMRLISQLKV